MTSLETNANARTPVISPIALKEYEVKQSESAIVGKLPIRSI